MDTEASIKRAVSRMVSNIRTDSPDYADQMQRISDWQDIAYRSANIFIPTV